MTKVFIEQPLASPGSTNYYTNKNRLVQAMAWKKVWTYFEVIGAIRSYLEPFEAI